jgi:hypothetical protein
MQLLPNCSSLWKCCLVLPLLLSSGACSSFKDVLPVTIKTVEIERNIPIQNRPRPLSLNDIHFYVVTEDTYAAFKQRFEKQNGVLVFYALSVRDYETLSLNMSEIKRFVAQQGGIISYYELAATPTGSVK